MSEIDLSHLGLFSKEIRSINPEFYSDHSCFFSSVPRLACCLLVDVSGSMYSYGRIEELNAALRILKEVVCQDPISAERVDICVISYGSAIEYKVPFCPIMEFEPPILQAGGTTNMSEGIRYALEFVNRQMDKYDEVGVKFYAPMILMITDGAQEGINNCEISNISELIANKERQGLLHFHTFGVHGADSRILSRLTEHVLYLGDDAFGEILNWTNKTINVICRKADGLYPCKTLWLSHEPHTNGVGKEEMICFNIDQKGFQQMSLHELLNDERKFPKSGIFHFFEGRMNYAQELSADEETALKKDLLWDLHQALSDGIILRLISSKSRNAHVVVTASKCILLTIYGAYLLKESWLFDEGELAVCRVKWMEEDHLAIVEFRRIPGDKQQRCVCYYPQNANGFIISGSLSSCEDCICMESKSYDSLDWDRPEKLPDTLPRVIDPIPIDDESGTVCFHKADGNGKLLRETIGFWEAGPEGKTEDERIAEMRDLLNTSVPHEENADENDNLQSGITISIDI